MSQPLPWHLDALARACALPALEAEPDGTCTLAIGERFELALRPHEDAQSLQLHARLGAVPAQGREAVLAQMLGANLFAPVLDTVLSLDADDLACLGCVVTLRELESVTLAQVVREFVGQAISWQALLAQAPAATAGASVGFPPNLA